MTNQQLSDAPGKILHFPSVMGAVVVAYNLPDFTGTLRLTGPVIADIYSGKITKWDDDQIKALNPGVAIPSQDIVVCHRSDGSGTSYIFTDYLSKVSPSLGDRSGQGYCGQVADRTRRQRQRRRDCAGAANAGRDRIHRVDLCAQQQDSVRAVAEQGGQLGRCEPGGRDGRGGVIGGPDGGRLPRVDHERAGRRCVSDLVVHVAARLSEADQQGCWRADQKVPELGNDARDRPWRRTSNTRRFRRQSCRRRRRRFRRSRFRNWISQQRTKARASKKAPALFFLSSASVWSML